MLAAALPDDYSSTCRHYELQTLDIVSSMCRCKINAVVNSDPNYTRGKPGTYTVLLSAGFGGICLS